MYCYNTNYYVNDMPVSSPGNLTDMARILARLTLLVGADACTPNIINSVWGADAEAQLVLGGPRGDLSLVCQKILTLLKVAINTVDIWMTNQSMRILSLDLYGFKCIPANSLTTALLHPFKQNLRMQTGPTRDCHRLPAHQQSAPILRPRLSSL
jgi:hypothetical protein